MWLFELQTLTVTNVYEGQVHFAVRPYFNSTFSYLFSGSFISSATKLRPVEAAKSQQEMNKGPEEEKPEHSWTWSENHRGSAKRSVFWI